jgi:Rhodopirellula transposase DDE domain
VYDIGADTGWVSVGCDGDTAAFAVQTIRRWWHTVGTPAYPQAATLLITADACLQITVAPAVLPHLHELGRKAADQP